MDEAEATYPVLIDPDRKFIDAYGIRNVPTVVWIDEDDRIVRPNSPEFGDDQFIEFHGRPSGPHLEALQRWIVDGEKPYASDAGVRADQFMPDEDQQLARTEYRLAVELWRLGVKSLAERHSCERANSHRTTSPSGAGRCRCGARIRSVNRSSSCTGSGKPSAAVLHRARRKTVTSTPSACR